MMTPEAGRALDAMVASKVMGAVACDAWGILTAYPPQFLKDAECGHAACFPKEMGPPAYSTDIAAAWGVVTKMMERTTFGLDWLGFDGEEWRCVFAWTAPEHNTDKPYAAVATTAPRAICLAALAAVGATR